MHILFEFLSKLIELVMQLGICLYELLKGFVVGIFIFIVCFGQHLAYNILVLVGSFFIL